jgi:hypothetical protein
MESSLVANIIIFILWALSLSTLFYFLLFGLFRHLVANMTEMPNIPVTEVKVVRSDRGGRAIKFQDGSVIGNFTHVKDAVSICHLNNFTITEVEP